MQRHDKWVTADNRRLWVFRQIERLGKCDMIPVRITNYIPRGKLTSYNGGESVVFRGSPGGYWHNRTTSGQRIYQIDEEIRAASQKNTKCSTCSDNNFRFSPYTQASWEPNLMTSVPCLQGISRVKCR